MRITRNAEAVVLALEGEVILRTAAAAVANVQPDSRIAPGDTLMTSADARVALALLPGALIHGEPLSEIRVKSLKLTKNGNRVQEAMRRQVHLELARGTLLTSVAFESTGEGVLIETPRGKVSLASPALCWIEVRDDATRVTCARGAVSFHARGDETPTTIQAPAFREWPAENQEQIPADFDVRATEEIEKAKEVEQKLLGLEERRRLSPFPWRR